MSEGMPFVSYCEVVEGEFSEIGQKVVKPCVGGCGSSHAW